MVNYRHQNNVNKKESEKTTMGMLEIMKKAHEEGEKRRLAQLAARTPEQIEREEEIRQIEIETHQKRTGTQTPPPPPQEATFVTDCKYVAGDTFQSQGATYTVLEESLYLSQKNVDEAEDGFDVFGLEAGWQTKARLV